MRYFLILLITFYQRFISPYKGCRCAYGCYHPGLSCSGQVKRILAEYGVIDGWPLICQQFRLCRASYDFLVNAQRQAENYRRDRYRLLRPVRVSRRAYARTAKGMMFHYLPMAKDVVGPRQTVYVCCFVIRDAVR